MFYDIKLMVQIRLLLMKKKNSSILKFNYIDFFLKNLKRKKKKFFLFTLDYNKNKLSIEKKIKLLNKKNFKFVFYLTIILKIFLLVLKSLNVPNLMYLYCSTFILKYTLDTHFILLTPTQSFTAKFAKHVYAAKNLAIGVVASPSFKLGLASMFGGAVGVTATILVMGPVRASTFSQNFNIYLGRGWDFEDNNLVIKGVGELVNHKIGPLEMKRAVEKYAPETKIVTLDVLSQIIRDPHLKRIIMSKSTPAELIFIGYNSLDFAKTAYDNTKYVITTPIKYFYGVCTEYFRPSIPPEPKPIEVNLDQDKVDTEKRFVRRVF